MPRILEDANEKGHQNVDRSIEAKTGRCEYLSGIHALDLRDRCRRINVNVIERQHCCMA